MTDCDDCQAKNPYRYTWHQPCCRVRFLLAQPNRDARLGWIERWRKAGETAMVAQVIAELRKLAEKSR